MLKAVEIDIMGIVSNIHYIKWFEDMRHVFLDMKKHKPVPCPDRIMEHYRAEAEADEKSA